MSDGNVIRKFEDALRARDIVVPRDLIADGALHRCDAAGRHGKGDAAYLLHLDGFPAGGLENHRDGRGWENWHLAPNGRDYSEDERRQHRQRIAEARRQRDADEQQRRVAAAAKAARMWAEASIESDKHPYLAAKHVGAHGARLWRDLLIVPVVDVVAGTLHSLQIIDRDRGKKFLTRGRTRGACYPIGELVDGSVILIAEGFATAATLYEATDYTAIAAFYAGNLAPVAQAIRKQYPSAKLIIAADDDHLNPNNPGLTKAREAAALVGGVVAVPDFGPDRPDSYTDFNDLAHFAGHDRVRQIFDAALVAPPTRRLLNIIRPTMYEGALVPERLWLVPDWIQMRRATALYGAGGEGKTLLAQMLATACAIGGQWIALPAFRCNSILLFCEDDPEEMHRRQADINAHYGCSLPTWAGWCGCRAWATTMR